MRKAYWILIVVAVLIVGWIFVRFIIGRSEDSWLKNEKGAYVKHGMPAETPDYVKEQQEAVDCALNFYTQEKNKGTELNSQCLGTCGNYVVDIVHVPRNEEDNLAENQCEDYRTGKVSYFIELDKEGNIVRVV